MHYREKQEWDNNKTPTAAHPHDSASLRKCKKVQKHLLVWGSWLTGCTAANIVASETSLFLLLCRAISASFLIRTSGKEYQSSWLDYSSTTLITMAQQGKCKKVEATWKQKGSCSQVQLVPLFLLFTKTTILELFCYRVVMIQKLKVSLLKCFLLLWPG